MMDTGDLNKRIHFQLWNEDNDDWDEEFYSCWAYVNGLSGSEYWEASALQAEETVVFRVRYCKKLSNIQPQTCRIKFNNNIFDIKHVDNIRFENEWLSIKGVMKHGGHS